MGFNIEMSFLFGKFYTIFIGARAMDPRGLGAAAKVHQGPQERAAKG